MINTVAGMSGLTQKRVRLVENMTNQGLSHIISTLWIREPVLFGVSLNSAHRVGIDLYLSILFCVNLLESSLCQVKLNPIVAHPITLIYKSCTKLTTKTIIKHAK